MGLARAEVESPQTELDPIQDQGQEGAIGRAREGQPDLFQDRTELLEPFVDVARDQELHGGAPPEFECLGGRGAGGRGEILSGRLGAAPGVGQGIRKGDPEFKGLVDKTLGAMMKSGQFAELYAKWFTKPIPPRNVNLNFPMTAPLKDAVASPNDKGV